MAHIYECFLNGIIVESYHAILRWSIGMSIADITAPAGRQDTMASTVLSEMLPLESAHAKMEISPYEISKISGSFFLEIC
jgi:hypothetical protein